MPDYRPKQPRFGDNRSLIFGISTCGTLAIIPDSAPRCTTSRVRGLIGAFPEKPASKAAANDLTRLASRKKL
jgi:hypothetical protein